MLCTRCNYDAPAGLRYCPACSNDLAPAPGVPASPAPFGPAPAYPTAPSTEYPSAQYPSGAYPQVPLQPSGAYPQVPLQPSGGYPQVPLPPTGGYPQVPLGQPIAYPPVSAPPGAYPPMSVPSGAYPQVSAIPLSAPPREGGRHGLLIAVLCLGVVAILGLGAVIAVHLAGGTSTSNGAPTTSGTPSSAGRGGGPSASTTTPGSSPSADRDAVARTQANAVNNLISTAMGSRAKLQAGLGEANDCSNLGDAYSKITSVVNDRTQQMTIAQGLDVDALDQGVALRSALVSAWTLSLQADQAYQRWVAWMYNGSHCGHNADWSTGEGYSQQSHPYKDQFVALWNPIASRYGLPTRVQTDI